MNVWFFCYLIGCVNICGWFLMSVSYDGWRRVTLLSTGFVSSLVLALALPLYIVVVLEMPAMLST